VLHRRSSRSRAWPEKGVWLNRRERSGCGRGLRRWGQGDRFLPGAPRDRADFTGHLKAVELRADESTGGLTRRAVVLAELVSGLHEFASETQGFGMDVGDLEGEYMPDSDEQLSGNGDDSLVATEAGLEACELSDPMGMGDGGGLGGFDQGSTQVTATGFGDLACAGGEARVVDASAQASVADQVFGIWKAGDVANSSQDGESRDEADARELEEKGQLRFLGGELDETGFEVGDLLAGKGQGIEIGKDAHFFDGRERQVEPPGAFIRGERVASAQQDMVTVEGGMQAVLSLGGEAGHFVALGQKSTPIAHCLGWDPDAFEHAFGE